MLTEAEKKWLGEREQSDYPAACKRNDPGYLMGIKDCHESCIILNETWGCPLIPDYEDTAEFEARVAAALAFAVQDCGDCDHIENCNDDCERVRLKYARLAVEAEMEESDHG